MGCAGVWRSLHRGFGRTLGALAALFMVLTLHAAAQSLVVGQSPWSIPPDVAPLDEPTRVRISAAMDGALQKLNARDYAGAAAGFGALITEGERIWGPDHPVTALFIRSYADSLNALERDTEAEAQYRRALTIIDQRMGEAIAPYLMAQLYAALGELLNQRRDPEAIAVLERVIALRAHDRNQFLGDSWALITAYAIANRQQDMARVGAEALQRAEQAFGDDLLMIARAQRLYGNALGQGADAQAYHARAAATARAYWESASAEERERRRWEIAEVLPFGFDQTPETIRTRAQQLLARGANVEAIDPQWRQTLRAYAEAEFEADRQAEAIGVMRSLAVLQERAQDDPIARNTNLWMLATWLRQMERDSDAEPVLQQVVALDRQSGSYSNSALYLWQLAAANVSLGRTAVAERALADMVAVADLAGGPGSNYALQYHNMRAFVLLNANRARAAEDAARSAWRAYQERSGLPINDRVSQRMRQGSISDTALLFVTAVWEQGGARTLTGARAAEVFEAMQDVTASQSANALAAGGARIAAGEAGLGELAAQWLDAQERITAFDDRILALASAGATQQRAELLASRAEQERTRRGAEEALRRGFGDFFELLMPSRVSLADAQAALGQDEALIMLTPGMPIVNAYATHLGFVLVVTRERVAWAHISMPPAELSASIMALHAQLQTGGATRARPGVGASSGVLGGARAFDRALAHRLYQAMFGASEVSAALAGKTRWTLAAQGGLLSMPFAALVTQTPEGENVDPTALRATHWLGLERTLSMTPSVSAIRAQRRERAAAPMTQQVAFFGLGDPAFDGAPGAARGLEMRDYFNARTANVAAVRALPRLPGTRTEIEQLAQAFGARREDYVLDVVATESEIARRNADGSLARAEVIAFATHGLVAGDLDQSLAEPALALTPPSTATDTDDGLLTASEAARLRLLNARWVILSACNTASGGEPNAEGLTGLARAFFYAGARTLLVSQWPVNDTAAQRLTTRAVELQRTRNLSAAASMRLSMADLVADTSRDESGRSFAHPSAWAPFVLISGE